MKNKFLKEQAEIKQAEIELHNKTQKLLYDILKFLDEKGDLDKLKDFRFNDDEYSLCIISVYNKNDVFYFNLIDYRNFTWELDDLSQQDQKSLIDYILENNLVSN